MTILCRVCADFTDGAGNIIFSVSQKDLNCVLTAPDAIQRDPLFGMLQADGSLEAVTTVTQRKTLENDPETGITAEGRKPSAPRRSDRKASERGASAKEPAAPSPAPEA